VGTEHWNSASNGYEFNQTSLKFDFYTSSASVDFTFSATAVTSNVLTSTGLVVDAPEVDGVISATETAQSIVLTFDCMHAAETTIEMQFKVTDCSTLIAYFTKVCVLPPLNQYVSSDNTYVVSNGIVVQDSNVVVEGDDTDTAFSMTLENSLYESGVINLKDLIYDSAILEPSVSVDSGGIVYSTDKGVETSWTYVYHCIAEGTSTVGANLTMDSFEDVWSVTWTKTCSGTDPVVSSTQMSTGAALSSSSAPIPATSSVHPSPTDNDDDDWVVWFFVILALVAAVAVAVYLLKDRFMGYRQVPDHAAPRSGRGVEMLHGIRQFQEQEISTYQV
jgi:hypothetical protein